MLHKQEFPDMKDIYIMMIQNKFCNQQITKAVREVMTTENGSVLWHCTEGKDRCGLLSAIILFLLDVSEEDVMEDYLKTNKAAIRRVEKIRKKLHVAGLFRGKRRVFKRSTENNERRSWFNQSIYQKWITYFYERKTAI